jgi:para-nitrobenzyl esterase
MTRRPLFPNILLVGLIVVTAHCKPATKKSSDVTSTTQDTSQPADSSQPAAAGLAGTSWRLVKFQSSDETILKPDDKSKYTIAFAPDGKLIARIDCNRGTGTWKSSGPPQLEFGPLALTRMACPPGSIDGKIVKQLPYVRSYVIKDGHLFLSLMADGGIFEFEPTANEQRR